MFANLLPGLREVRVPLAAGCLFLITVWALFNDQIDPGRGASDTVDAIVRLKDQLGTAAFAAALSFVAYLLGALWEPAATCLEPRLCGLWLRVSGDWERREVEVKLWRLRLRAWLLKRRKLDVWAAIREDADRASRPRGIRVSKEGWQQLWGVAGRLLADVDQKVRGKLHVTEEEDSFDALVRASQVAYELSLHGLGLETLRIPSSSRA